jgi:hypothetical protein
MSRSAAVRLEWSETHHRFANDLDVDATEPDDDHRTEYLSRFIPTNTSSRPPPIIFWIRMPPCPQIGIASSRREGAGERDLGVDIEPDTADFALVRQVAADELGRNRYRDGRRCVSRRRDRGERARRQLDSVSSQQIFLPRSA